MAGEVNVNSFKDIQLKAFAQAADQDGNFKLDSVEKKLFENLVEQSGLAMEDEYTSVMGEAAANAPDEKTAKKQTQNAEKADEQRYKNAFGKSYNKETMATIRTHEAEANARVGNAFKQMTGHVDPRKMAAHIAQRPDVSKFNSVADYTAALTRWADGMDDLGKATTNDLVSAGFSNLEAKLDEQTGAIMNGIIQVGQQVVDVLEEDLKTVSQNLEQQIKDGTAQVIKQVKSSTGAIIQQIKTAEGRIIEVARQEGRITRATVAMYGDANLQATQLWGMKNLSETRKYGEANLAETHYHGVRNERAIHEEATKTRNGIEAVNGEVAKITSGLDNHNHLGPTRRRVQNVMAKITNSTLPTETKVQLLNSLGELANDVNIRPDEIDSIEAKVDKAIKSANAEPVAKVKTGGTVDNATDIVMRNFNGQKISR